MLNDNLNIMNTSMTMMTVVTYGVKSFFERARVNPTSRNTSSHYSHNLIIEIAMVDAMVRVND